MPAASVSGRSDQRPRETPFCSSDGTEERCTISKVRPPRLFGFRYFGSEVEIGLASDGKGGTDLTLTNTAQGEFWCMPAGCQSFFR